jgi:hypothetical protein
MITSVTQSSSSSSAAAAAAAAVAAAASLPSLPSSFTPFSFPRRAGVRFAPAESRSKVCIHELWNEESVRLCTIYKQKAPAFMKAPAGSYP